MNALVQLFFILAPLIGQGIIDISKVAGVTHGTWALSLAGWLLALTVSGRAVVSQQKKNVANGSDQAGGGA